MSKAVKNTRTMITMKQSVIIDQQFTLHQSQQKTKGSNSYICKKTKIKNTKQRPVAIEDFTRHWHQI